MSLEQYLYLVPIAGILALLFAWSKSAWINKLCCEDAQMPSGWKLNSQKENNTIWD